MSFFMSMHARPSTQALRMLPALGGTVDVWGARRIIAYHKLKEPIPSIAAHLGCGISTVKTVIAHYKEAGEARVPQQGRGRRDDPRWVFAGPQGPGRLAALCQLKESRPDDALLIEVHAETEQLFDHPPAYSTDLVPCHALWRALCIDSCVVP